MIETKAERCRARSDMATSPIGDATLPINTLAARGREPLQLGRWLHLAAPMVSTLLPIVQAVAPTEGHPLQREPYRLFFPLGMALSFAGVGHWLLFALGVMPSYHSIFHAMTQIQGFLLCFAIGFLFTMIPRRTQTRAPSMAQLAIGAIAPVGTTVAAWLGLWAWAQAFWLIAGAMLIGFLVSRIRSSKAKRRPPNSFVWLPVGFAMGMGGAVLAGVGAALGPERWWIHQLGQMFVLQGMFLALVMGVGSLALPLMTRGEMPADGATTPADRRARLGHLLAAAALVTTFVMEALGWQTLAYLGRGTLVLLVLIDGAQIHRRPSRPGWNRWLIWLAAWAIPAGYLLAALLDPAHAKAALHVTFIGGLAMLTFAVSTQVTLGHGGFDGLMQGRPWAVAAIGALLVVATIARVLLSVDPARYLVWMGIASGAFVLAGLAWSIFLLPKLLRVR